MSISLEPMDRSSQNFVCRSPVALARSSSGGVAIHCVLSVSWLTSHLAIMTRMVMHGRLTIASGIAIPGQSLMSMNSFFCLQAVTDY